MRFGSEQALSSSPPSPLWGWVANAASRAFSPQPLSRELSHLKNIPAYCQLNLDNFEISLPFCFLLTSTKKKKKKWRRGRIRWISNHYIANLSQWSDFLSKEGSRSTLIGIAGSCQLRSTWAAGRVEARGQGYTCHLYFPSGKMVSNSPLVNLNKKHQSCEVRHEAERTAANRGSEAGSHFSPLVVHQGEPACLCASALHSQILGHTCSRGTLKKPELCWEEHTTLYLWPKRWCKSLVGFMG